MLYLPFRRFLVLNLKMIVGIFLLTFSLKPLSAQEYKKKMSDLSINFYEVVEAAETHFQNHDKGPGSGYKGYLRWKYENEAKYYPDGNRQVRDPYVAAQAFWHFYGNNRAAQKKKSGDTWHDLGPYNAKNYTVTNHEGIGRVECFYVSPKKANIFYIGSRSGGFWYSIDDGKNWTNTTDFLVASGVNTIAVSPKNRMKVYINVRNGLNGTSHGIYYSEDGGQNWTETKFNPRNLGWGGLGSNHQIHKIAFHPLDETMVFAGTGKGLYVTTDGFETYTQVLDSAVITDIEFHPTKRKFVYVLNTQFKSDHDKVLISEDFGSTFSVVTTVPGNLGEKGYLSVSQAAPDHLYFASTRGVAKSRNKGQSFTHLSNPYESCRAFAVSSKDTLQMLYGFVNLRRSENGGKSFVYSTFFNRSGTTDERYIHADARTVESVNGVFYAGTDGYFARSKDNGKTWERLNEGTGIRENYSVAVSQGNYDYSLCGAQDNGTAVLKTEGWTHWLGADGMEAIIQPLNEQWLLGSYQLGTRNYSRDGGLTAHDSKAPQATKGDWVAPLLLDPNDHMRVLHFVDGIYSSSTFGSEWESLSSVDMGGNIQQAAIAHNNSQIMAISKGSDLRLSTNGGKDFSPIWQGLPSSAITDIEFSPNNDSTITVTYNRYEKDFKKIFLSTNLGKTWQNITYNLGNVPLRCAVIDHSDSAYIYVGSEIGVFYKPMVGKKWKLFNEDLPNVSVYDLVIHFGSNTLRAATWGRGLWETSLAGRVDFPKIKKVGLTQEVTLFSPAAGISQKVTAYIDVSRSLDRIYLKWGTDWETMDNELAMRKVKDGEWESVQPIKEQDEDEKVYFKVFIVDANGTSETYRFMYEIRPFEPCISKAKANSGTNHISRFKIDKLENVSGKDYYGDYTHLVARLIPNKLYQVEIELNNSNGKERAATWIDYNRNATFDAEELIAMEPFDANGLSKAKFLVPKNAVTGDTLRLRTSFTYDKTPVPCGSSSSDVEDYSVLLNWPVGMDDGVEENVSLYPNPSKGTFELTLKNHDQAQARLLDLSGKVHHEFGVEEGSQTLSLKLVPGVYVLEVKASTNTYFLKLMVQ